jgi:hypothetical protein
MYLTSYVSTHRSISFPAWVLCYSLQYLLLKKALFNSRRFDISGISIPYSVSFLPSFTFENFQTTVTATIQASNKQTSNQVLYDADIFPQNKSVTSA